MLAASLHPLLVWLQLHPHWAGLITGIICFFECCLVVGLLIPGTVIMTAIGTFIGLGFLPFSRTVLWAIAGAIIGDTFSFCLGYHYQQRLRDFWPFCRYPKLLQQGKTFFQRYGKASIFIGRFAGPIRSLLPVIAGMVMMPVRHFLIADISSAILWAPASVLPGIILGQASQQLPPVIGSQLIILVILVLLLLWLLSTLIKLFFCWTTRLFKQQIINLWQAIRRYPPLQNLTGFLAWPHDPDSPLPLILALVFCFSVTLLLTLLYSVIQNGTALAWNPAIYHFMRSLRSPFLDHFFISVTLVGPNLLAALWLVLLVWFIGKREPWVAIYWGMAGLLALGGGSLLKDTIHFPRPIGITHPPVSGSFPSGHVLTNLVFLGFLANLLTIGRSLRCRWLSYGLVGLWILTVILARLYLGAHWLSDIIGSILLGTAILSLLSGSYQRKQITPLAPMGPFILASLTLSIGYGLEAYYHYPQYQQQYAPLYQSTPLSSLAHWWKAAEQQQPLYRTNRFGQPSALFNLQWLGLLVEIQAALEQRGWQTLTKTTLLKALYSPNAQKLLFSPLNAGQRAALVMKKQLSQNQMQLVLYLWKAGLQLENGPPLWAGLLDYHSHWEFHWLRFPEIQSIKWPAPTDLLLDDLQPFIWKQVTYPSLQTKVLYIRPPNLNTPIGLTH